MVTAFEAMAQSGKAGEKPQEEAPLRVLIVEDDPDQSSILREVLTSHGFSVAAAADGIEAEKIISGRPFDVVVSDIRMPNMDGLELARRLAVRERPPAIILITAFPSPRTVELGYTAGAARVLSKPFSLEKFIQWVGEVGRGRRPGP